MSSKSYRDHGTSIPGLRLIPVWAEFPSGHLSASLSRGWRGKKKGTVPIPTRRSSTLKPPVVPRLAHQQWVFNYLNIASALCFQPGLLCSAKGKSLSAALLGGAGSVSPLSDYSTYNLLGVIVRKQYGDMAGSSESGCGRKGAELPAIANSHASPGIPGPVPGHTCPLLLGRACALCGGSGQQGGSAGAEGLC